MRTFVAIDLPSEIRRKLAQLIDQLKPLGSNVRWARPDGLHVTLKFLGEIPPEKVPEVIRALSLLQAPAPLSIAVRGAGCFPNERAPRVIWLGVDGGAGLLALAREVEESLVPLGIPKEGRAFSAHLTLGRLKVPDKLLAVREFLRRQEPLELGSFTAGEFFLYESQLAPGGSLYRKVARFPLAARDA